MAKDINSKFQLYPITKGTEITVSEEYQSGYLRSKGLLKTKVITTNTTNNYG